MRTRIPVVPIVSSLGMAGLVLLLILWNEGASDSSTPRSAARSASVPRSDGSEPATASDQVGKERWPTSLMEETPTFQLSPVRFAVRLPEFTMDVGEETGDPKHAKVLIHIRNESGQPLSGLSGVASHVLRPACLLAKATTDEQGLMEIPAWGAEHCELEVSMDELTLRTEFICKLGRVNSTSLVVPPPGIPVRGTVSHRRSGPVPKVTVTLHRAGADWPRLTYRSSTDRYGFFQFAAVAAGDYRARVSTPMEPNNLDTRISVPENGSVERNLVIGFRSIQGTVRSAASGKPIEAERAYFHVSASTGDGNMSPDLAPCLEPEKGAFWFLDLAPGVHCLRVSSAGYLPATVDGVDVKMGEETLVDVTLQPAAVLNLTVCLPDGAPYRGHLIITVGNSFGGSSEYTRTADENGKSRIDSLPAGAYRIRVKIANGGTAEATAQLACGQNELAIQLEPILSDS